MYKNKKQDDDDAFNTFGSGATIDNSLVDGGIYYVSNVLGSRIKLTRAAAGDSNTFTLGATDIYTDSQITPIEMNSGSRVSFKLTPDQTPGLAGDTGTVNGVTGDGSGGGIVYNPNTGLMQIKIVGHALQTGDLIKIDDYSLVFTCALDVGNGPHGEEHRYPRPYNPNLDGTPDPGGTATVNTSCLLYTSPSPRDS